jgi:hypothetical protein
MSAKRKTETVAQAPEPVTEPSDQVVDPNKVIDPVEPDAPEPVVAQDGGFETPAPEVEAVPEAAEAPPVADDEVEPLSTKEAFRAKVKAKFRDALAAQPHRGYPSFEDLLVIGDVIVDAFVDGQE